MKHVRLTAAATAAAMALTGAASASAAPRAAQDADGARVPVVVPSLDVFREPAKIYLGNLQAPETFRVSKLSASGKYAYGTAFGDVDEVGWVLASGLGIAAAPVPRLVGTPSVRYTVLRKQGLGRFLSVAVVLRTDRALPRRFRHAVAAPSLDRGDELPDALFGGLTLRTIGDRGHCYVGEVSQLRRRSRVSDGKWRLGLFTRDEVLTPTRSVTLKRERDVAWQRRAVERLGCD